MHINLHKKDEFCIKTYFLHKKTSPACVFRRRNRNIKNPYPYGDRDCTQGLALTSFLRGCFLRFHNTSVLVVTETFLELSIGFQADFLCCHKIKYLIFIIVLRLLKENVVQYCVQRFSLTYSFLFWNENHFPLCFL